MTDFEKKISSVQDFCFSPLKINFWKKKAFKTEYLCFEILIYKFFTGEKYITNQ